MINWKSASLARSAVLMAVAALLPVIIFASLSAYVAVRAEQAELSAQAMADAGSLAVSIDRQLDEDMDEAQNLAALPELDDIADPKPFEEVARRAKALHPGWLGVVLVGLDGRWIYNTSSPGERHDVQERASYDEVLRTGRPKIGDIAPGRLGGFGIPVRAPVIRNGKLIAVVTVVERPVGVRALIRDLRMPSAWIVTIVDRGGKIVARSQNEDLYVGKAPSANAQKARARGVAGLYKGLTLEGVPTMSAFAVAAKSGWTVHIGMPDALFFAPLRRLIAILLAAFVVCILMAAGLVALLARDVESRRAHAAAIEQATRIEALGRLTGGVAHDFNNLLTVIQGNVEILRRRLADNPAAERPLAGIKAAGERAAQLTRQLLVFARGGSVERSLLDVETAVVEHMSALAQLAGPDIELVNRFDPALPLVRVDPLQFQAALLNLVANARDAMNGAEVQGRKLIEISVRLAQGQVRLSVRDHGPGFDISALSRVFEPFYTTKPIGRGTGLGLSQVYGFARASEGRVEAANAPGGGAVVTMVFPAAEPQAPVPLSVEPKAASPAPRVCVLLVDDNEAVRHATAGFLRECGLSVVEARDGAQALELAEEEPFDAVVSDIMMPGEHDGIALAQALAGTRPGLPVLLVTGYSDRAAEAQGRGLKVITKPYSLAELEQRLRAAVAASRPVPVA